jgi:opacity protein-like surface antigen
MPRPASVPFAPVLGACAVVATLAAPAGAQTSGDGFLLGRPRATLTLRGGYDRFGGRGEVFQSLSDQLTLGPSSLGGAALGGELAVTLTRRVDLTFNGGFASSTRGSEARRFVNQDDTPIRQTTTLRRVPLGVGLKAYLAPRGREIGRFAWIPAQITPFVGAGGGAVWYRLRLEGDFVDAQTLRIFTVRDDAYAASGWVPAGYASAGADWSLSPRLVASGEFRYTLARGTPDGAFGEFNRIDLSGAALTVGLGVRF